MVEDRNNGWARSSLGPQHKQEFTKEHIPELGQMNDSTDAKIPSLVYVYGAAWSTPNFRTGYTFSTYLLGGAFAFVGYTDKTASFSFASAFPAAAYTVTSSRNLDGSLSNCVALFYIKFVNPNLYCSFFPCK